MGHVPPSNKVTNPSETRISMAGLGVLLSSWLGI